MPHDWKRLDRHGLSSEPGQPVLMSATIDKLDEYAGRIAELEAKLAKAVDGLTKIEHIYFQECTRPSLATIRRINDIARDTKDAIGGLTGCNDV